MNGLVAGMPPGRAQRGHHRRGLGRALLRAGVAAGMAAVLSGCGMTVWYSVPTTTSGTSASSTPPTVPAAPPRVDQPKQLRGLSPCGLLTEAQRGEFGISVPGTGSRVPANDTSWCHWSNFAKDQEVMANLEVKTWERGGGLPELYRRKSEFTSFVPATVDSYPAVRTEDDKTTCRLHVGVGDDQGFEVKLLGFKDLKPLYPQVCDQAEKIAAAMLRNIPTIR
ncbi:DUF3558 domain-containing protein [Crossiella sp. SN42]|uniref:DUF3558 domain-containing protein n=1 Tax=Crossiella sp. SN42 TaxID=2944808 RepID=UPI00207CC039|nr:DUF3558 domain-containing protein [Crossiella sp. SN42]MCO1575866.1 DUF3558 domain-containing protein [Crossiella sp. SN42]